MKIDLRSDTVTKPTPEMLERMLSAETGDDVFGEDPTVNELQNCLANYFGHEAGLFCPSGTMTNQIAINVHVRPGDEVICHSLSHIYNYEGGGIARNSGASVRLIDGDNGRFTAQQAQMAINPSDSHYARTSLIAVEDTCNKGGGCYYDIESLKALSSLAKERKLGFHLDGARVFNALVETGVDAKVYGALFDSVSVCLSKGLGTPAGSVLLGSKSFIAEAHRVRKAMGGGMRQVGILAAAGLYAIEHHIDRLKEDHANAKSLERLLKSRSWVEEVLPVDTNIVIFKLANGMKAEDQCKKMAVHGIHALPFGSDKIRFVTHLDFHSDHLVQMKDIFAKHF